MQSELKPCPFCGSHDVRLRHHQANEMSWVSCVGCGLEAPSETGVSDDAAVTYWNRRTEAALSAAEPSAQDRERVLAQVASIICEETCGLTSKCKSREAAKALFDKGYLSAPTTSAVAVKPLQWVKMDDGETFHAQSILGRWATWEGHYLPPDGYGGIACADPVAAAQADFETRIRSALSAQVQDVAEVSPSEYMRRHDAAIAAYEANTPNDYRYSALALRKAVDAAFAVAAAPAKQEG